MSGAVGGVLDYATYSRLAQDAAQVKQQLDQVTQQSASGMIADTYGGLGDGARVSLDLRPEIAQAQAWQANVTAAGSRLSTTDDVLNQLQTIASDFYAQVTSLGTATASQVTSIAQSARSALQQVAALLNTTQGGAYVLAGQDTANPPVPNAQNILSSPFFTQIQAQVATLTAGNAAAVAAGTLAAASNPANSPYSTTMGTALPQVQVGPGQFVAVGVIAGTNAAAPSTGTSTTGSYATDLMRALATVGSLTSAQAGLDPGFNALLVDTQASLRGAIDAIGTDRAMIGGSQQVLSVQGDDLSKTVTLLTAQVSGAEDTDMAAASTRLSQLQAQLQASYRMIADVNQLSLASFLQA